MRSGTANTDRPVMVGKYTQTRQRWLKAKIVKSNHGRHYKKGPLPCTGRITITVIVISRREIVKIGVSTKKGRNKTKEK